MQLLHQYSPTVFAALPYMYVCSTSGMTNFLRVHVCCCHFFGQSSGQPEMVRAQMKQQQRSQESALPYDAKAVDAWAMGVLLYLLVTGCYPFEVGGWTNRAMWLLLPSCKQ